MAKATSKEMCSDFNSLAEASSARATGEEGERAIKRAVPDAAVGTFGDAGPVEIIADEPGQVFLLLEVTDELGLTRILKKIHVHSPS